MLLQLVDDWRILICFFTTDDILGRAGFNDITKGVRSVFVFFCSGGCSVAPGLLRDVKWRGLELHLSAGRSGCNLV